MELVLRTSVVLAGAWVAAFALRRTAASTRHLLWQLSLAAVIAAPLLAPLAPRFPVPALTIGQSTAQQETALSSGSASTPRRMTGSPLAIIAGASEQTLAWRDLWTAGSIAVAAWFLIGWMVAARTTRRSRMAPAAWQVEANDVAARIGLARYVRVRVRDGDGSPLAVGLFKPSVLLPPSATDWPADERRAVLAHELAHVARHDLPAQLLWQTACAMYWFNPLAWLAAAALRRERERACDDEVLRQGVRPSTYAASLLRVATLVNRRPAPSAALAMTSRGELERRLLAVLDARPRRATSGPRMLVWAGVFLFTFAAVGAAPGGVSPAVPASSLDAPRWTVASTPPRDTSSPRIDALAAALEDPSASVREKATLALVFHSSREVVEPLVRALTDADEQVREKAALGLALRNDPRVVEPLLAALKDRDAQVREKAALSLATTGDPRARAALETAARDPDAQVREKALAGLALLDTPVAGSDRARLADNLGAIAASVLTLAR